MFPESRPLIRTAWLVVALLFPVALLNYLDRQMLAAMKVSVMHDIPDIASQENWGFLLGAFKWVYAALSRNDSVGVGRRAVQPKERWLPAVEAPTPGKPNQTVRRPARTRPTAGRHRSLTAADLAPLQLHRSG